MTEFSKRTFRNPWFWSITLLILLRILFLALAVHDIPQTGVNDTGVWWTTGGDAASYYGTTEYLIGEKATINKAPFIGFPLLLIAERVVTGTHSFYALFNISVFINGILIYGIATILVYFLAKEFLQRKYKAFIITAVFSLYPYLFYAAFAPLFSGSVVIANFTTSRFLQLMFFTAESDPLAFILVLGSLLVIVQAVKDKGKLNSYTVLMLGLIVGWAVVTRVQNGVLVPLYSLVFLYYKKFENILIYGLGMLPFALFQFFINQQAAGGIFDSPYNREYMEAPGREVFVHYKYFANILNYPLDHNPLLFIPIALGAALVLWGMWLIAKQYGRVGGVVIIYTFSMTVPLFFLEITMRNPRYFLPVIPLLIIFSYISVEYGILRTSKWKKTKKLI